MRIVTLNIQKISTCKYTKVPRNIKWKYSNKMPIRSDRLLDLYNHGSVVAEYNLACIIYYKLTKSTLISEILIFIANAIK